METKKEKNVVFLISKYIKYVRGNVYNNQNKTKKMLKREYRGLRSLCSRIKQSEVITMKIIYNSEMERGKGICQRVGFGWGG